MYPTKEQILETPHKHKVEVIQVVKAWKREFYNGRWGNMGAEEKLAALNELANAITPHYEAEPVEVLPYTGGSGEYGDSKIYLSKPSIVTTLHELAHHMFGPDELKACRWSVWLFIKTFPKAYEKLVWQGHMLVRPEDVSVGFNPFMLGSFEVLPE